MPGKAFARLALALTLIVMGGVGTVFADQQTDPVEQLRALQQRVEELERQNEAQRDQIDSLKKDLQATLAQSTAPAPAEGTTEPSATAETAQPSATAATAELAEPAPVEPEIPIPEPAPVMASAAGKNFLNLSLDGLVAAGASTARDIEALQPGGHDPSQRGFTIQNVEAVFEGAVDPYFKGQANIVLQITPEGETQVELEEVYATSTSLPRGLQFKAGQFFSEFGRLNTQHPHSWDFVDQPLVNGRFFGPDGLRSAGARISWLIPTSYYSEAFLSVQNSQGETATSFRGVPGETFFGRDIQERPVAKVTDLLIVPRYAASFDLSDTQTLLVGASGAFGPNGTGDSGKTRIYGIDGFWKWKPTNAFRGFPFVKIQGEIMQRRASVGASALQGLEAATFHDYGGYLQVSWGYKAGRILGLRFDRVGGDQGDPSDDALAPRWRVSPALTWFPTEYSKLRLQYNFDRRGPLLDDAHSLWLQLEFLLGAHAAHKF
jgi:hypothetical protein